VRRLVTQKTVPPDRGARSLRAYVDLPIRRHGHLGLLGRVFELQDHFTAYDAAYVALAEQLSATLITSDERLTQATRQHVSLNVIGIR
jgi:predicted nucleic acid-binding protein